MRLTPILFALALAGCGASDDAPGPGGVTRGEARQMDEAAAATDVNATFANEGAEAAE